MKLPGYESLRSLGTAVLVGVVVTELGLLALAVFAKGDIRLAALKAAVAILIAYGVYWFAKGR